VKQAISHSA